MQFETVTTEEFKMFEKIQAYLASQLDIPADEITRDTTFESLGVDSLDTVEMVMDLEEHNNNCLFVFTGSFTYS